MLTWQPLQVGTGLCRLHRVSHRRLDASLASRHATLCVTPFPKILHLPELIRFRRMLGLFAFFYACLHFTSYIWLDKFFDLSEMWKDIAKRKHITVGLAAFLLLIPLAVTSTAGWIRRLGGKRWQLLHRLIYGRATLGVIHDYWLVKSAVIRPVTYGVIVGVLLLWRLFTSLAKKKPVRV
jgi:sulfoxide reductase heme-binding subunit YedZ